MEKVEMKLTYLLLGFGLESRAWIGARAWGSFNFPFHSPFLKKLEGVGGE